MDADGETGGRVSPQAANPSPMAKRALCRQTPKVGAECPNWACSELSGGRSEMSVPTGKRARFTAAKPMRASKPVTNKGNDAGRGTAETSDPLTEDCTDISGPLNILTYLLLPSSVTSPNEESHD